MSFKSIESVINDTKGYIDGLEDQVVINQTLMVMGAFFALINIFPLLIFLTYQPFRMRFQILIALTIADFVNCLAIMWTGLKHSELFMDVIETRLMPIRSPWECAFEAWLLLREIGDLWAPIIQIVMGIERMLAVFKPVLYNQTYQTRSIASIAFSILFVLVSVGTALGIASTRRDTKVPYYCGRKASFGSGYGIFVYIINVFCYSFGFLLNFIAYCKVRTFLSATEKNKNLARLRYYLVISALSTVLVSIPNLINLISAVSTRLPDTITKAAVWLTALNSGINFFVYLALNEDFRERCLTLIGLRKKTNIPGSQRTVWGQQPGLFKMCK